MWGAGLWLRVGARSAAGDVAWSAREQGPEARLRPLHRTTGWGPRSRGWGPRSRDGVGAAGGEPGGTSASSDGGRQAGRLGNPAGPLGRRVCPERAPWAPREGRAGWPQGKSESGRLAVAPPGSAGSRRRVPPPGPAHQPPRVRVPEVPRNVAPLTCLVARVPSAAVGVTGDPRSLTRVSPPSPAAASCPALWSRPSLCSAPGGSTSWRGLRSSPALLDTVLTEQSCGCSRTGQTGQELPGSTPF